ncbi:MAG: hypothetical protein WCD80_12080 [Desulfobaccales bacterium]
MYLWFRGEVMITDGGYSSVEEFTRKRLAEKEAATRQDRPSGQTATD